METFHERRKFPRAAIEGLRQVTLPVSCAVQLLDISEQGVLMASAAAPLPRVGQRGRLRAMLGSESFSAEVEIRRLSQAVEAPGQVRIGAAFVSVEENSRRAIERFLKRTRSVGEPGI
jgi:c-di-GMP-binding flagellar brake protein YcgR